MKSLNRFKTAFLGGALALTGTLAYVGPHVFAAPNAPQVTLDASKANPRQVEDSTEQAIVRDYSGAWKNLAAAVDKNSAGVLDASFVGFARDQFGKLIADQAKNGLHQRYVDHGHKVQVLFYSPDGSAMQVRDTAQLEVQLLDGDKVISSQPVTESYIAVLTPAENSWKVRVLEAVPAQ